MYNYVNRLKKEIYGHYQMCYVEIKLTFTPMKKDKKIKHLKLH